MKQLSQKEFEKCPKWLKKPKTFHSKLETLRYETIPIILFILILWGKNYLLYYRYRCYRYRYRPIWKLSYRYFIGIGRYEKKLIGRTLIIPCKVWTFDWLVQAGILNLGCFSMRNFMIYPNLDFYYWRTKQL